VPKASDNDAPERGEAKRKKGAIRERVAWESERRARLAVPAFAGGVLYLLGSITTSNTLKDLPTVGVVQGVAPALGGLANPAVSPRAAEVRYYDHHAFALLVGSVMGAASLGVLLIVLLFLFDVTRFRRPETAPMTRLFILLGGIGLPVLTIVGGLVQTLDAHNFVSGHDFTTRAVEHALTKNTAYEILGYITPLSALALVGGMVALMVATVRTGLQPRWLGIVGGAAAIILLVPSQELSLITAFWMVATGIVLMGRLPGGDPPAWAAGEARPWPSQSAARVARQQKAGGGGGGRGAPGAKEARTPPKEARKPRQEATVGDASSDAAPDPVRPASRGSEGRRRRKRGSRG
jgi:hypothetical protein